MQKIHLSRTVLIISVQVILLFILLAALWIQERRSAKAMSRQTAPDSGPEASAAWISCSIPSGIMEQAFRLDINSCQAPVHLSWIDLLACLGSEYGGDFSRFQQEDLDALANALSAGAAMDQLVSDPDSFSQYRETYQAVLGGLVGYFRQEADAPEIAGSSSSGSSGSNSQGNSRSDAPGSSNGSLPGNPDGNSPGSSGGNLSGGSGSDTPAPSEKKKVWVTKYGLKAFSPIAMDFPYTDSDDFNTKGLCGRSERHLGHDMAGQEGTPIIAVESGTVESMSWNRENGWQLGIRSLDNSRYYLYGHLRKNYPYQSNLDIGSHVTAGDVIGYLGRTGGGEKENTDQAVSPHLHFGLQIRGKTGESGSFDGIWVDCSQLIRFLGMNQSKVEKIEGTMEWNRVYRQEELDDGSL